MIYNETEKQNLYNDYIINNLSRKEMMEKYNLTKKQLTVRLSFYQIKKEDVELISKEKLAQLYQEENKTILEITNITGLSDFQIRTYIKKYNLTKSKEQIQKTREKTNLEKYNCINPGMNKSIQNKIKQTCQKKYNANSPLEAIDIQNKIKQTCQQKYGVDYILQSKEQQLKLQEAVLQKYGTKIAISSPKVREKIYKTNIDKYGVKCVLSSPEIKEKIKNTNLIRYGTEYAISSNIVKNKIHEKNLQKFGVEMPLCSDVIKQKIAQTNIEKYGVENVFGSPIIRDKIKSTFVEKYGGPAPIFDKSIKERFETTMISRYGVTHALQNKDILDKSQNTCLKNFGVKFPTQNKEILNRIKETNLTKYGVPWFCMTDKCQNAAGTFNSKPNLQFADILEKNHIDFTREYKIQDRSYDFKINQTLIEINPTTTHNSFIGIHQKPGIDPNYHLLKSQLAFNNNFNCIHIFDWDDKEKISKMFMPKTKLYARKCQIKIVDSKTVNSFLKKYHFQNSCRGQNVNIGLYYEDNLVELMTFGKPRYNKNYQYELLRLCYNSEYTVLGGSQKLFNYFISEYKPKNVLSYCDNAKFNGRVYQTLGFKLNSFGRPAIHWYNIKTKEHITDNLLRQRGFDQLFKTNFGKGTSNNELMHLIGFVEVYDCGQSTYTWENKNG